MATTKKTAKTASRSVRSKPKNVKFQFQRPSELPIGITLPSGSTIKELANLYNVSSKGYIWSVNGETVDSTYEIHSDDVIRVGVQTKDN